MIVVDANILIYAHISDFDQHAVAREWLDDRLNGRTRVGLPWSSLLALLRLVTNPRIFARLESVESAWRQVEERFDCEAAWLPEPSDRNREILGELIA
jgi:predicted nucleic acid-binding protein